MTTSTARVQLLVSATLVAGSLAAAAAVVGAVTGPAPVLWQVLLLAVLVPLSERALLHVRFGGDQYSFTWGEATVLLGCALVAPSWLVLVAGPCTVLVHLAAGRGRVKSLFNGATFGLAAGAAGLVHSWVSTPPYGVSTVSDVAGLVLAATVFSAVSTLLVSAVVGAVTGAPTARVVRSNARMSAVVLLGNTALGLGVLGLAERSPLLLAVVPPLLLVVGLAYRAYLAAAVERDAWQQLEETGRDLNRLEEDEVVATALTRAAQLFRTDRVALELLPGVRPARGWMLDAGTVVRGAPGGAPVGRVVPLQGPSGPMGHLEVCVPDGLSAHEERVLSTFARTVATTLANAALHEAVCSEALRHEHEATHDALTGLANRMLLQRRTVDALGAARGTTALLLLDLDHFKTINDTLGHAAGDVLLQEIARRLGAVVRRGDLVARLGGDEFAVLLTGLASPADAEKVADSVLKALTARVAFEGLDLLVEGSIGIACHPHDAVSAEELFRRCDIAMYQAKSDHVGWVRYDTLRDDSSVARLALVAQLEEALAEQLVVHFQPQIALGTGLMVGAEALVRWQHPERGLLQPASFVGVVEQSGLVRDFTLRVLDLAVAECTRWQSHGRPISVAVNLGARSLLDRQLPDDVAEVLSRHGLSPDLLVLEITETTAASDLLVVEEVLGRLRRLGVEISVDDFGTGFSSLAFLQRTAVHELKVDRSFVSGMLVNDNDLALVRATIQLAHSLGARAVAEGVESLALQLALASLGCDIAQGYHFSRPVVGEKVRALLRSAASPVLPAPRSENAWHLTVAG